MDSQSNNVHLDDKHLSDAISAELKKTSWSLKFNTLLEAQYEQDNQAERRQDLFNLGAISVVVYVLFLFNDWLTRPEIIEQAIIWRLFAAVYCLITLWYIRTRAENLIREVLISSCVVMITFSACQIFFATQDDTAAYDPFIFSLILMASNTLLPLKFVYGLATTIISVAMTLIYVFNHPYVSQDAASFIIGLLVGMGIFSLIACYRLERGERNSYLLLLRESLQSKYATQSANEYEQLSLLDMLTALPNRRAFNAKIDETRTRSSQSAPSLMTVIMIDIDYFKVFNDSLGHIAGDKCLRDVAEAMRSVIRDSECIARFGGEEFIVLLPRSNKQMTEITCERLRTEVEAMGLSYQHEGREQHVTISLGAVLTKSNTSMSIDSLIQVADDALYQAKSAGRNQWRIIELDE